MITKISITGIGSFVPIERLTNKGIEQMRPPDIDPKDWTDEDWIWPRTGIAERRIAPDNWGSSDMMVLAGLKAMENAGVEKEDLDCIITSTSFADYGFNIPRTAEVVKDKLDLPQTVLSLEENAECAGFCWALARAEMEMRTRGFKKVLVTSGDKTTCATNYSDRNTCILFGDAAGAVVLEADKNIYPFDGLIASLRGTITREGKTSYIDTMSVPAGGSKRPLDSESLKTELGCMQMPGGRKMLEALGGRIIPEICQKTANEAGISLEKIKYIIPHQANIRISQMIAKRLGLADDVVFTQTQKWFGNTSGSSVPLALDYLYQYGKLTTGDLIMLVGFGAGFTYGTNLIIWTKPKINPVRRRSHGQNSRNFFPD